MFDEPEQPKSSNLQPPEVRAAEKADECRMLAEIAAAFEGPRKFDADLLHDLTRDQARDIQQAIGKLEKQRIPPGNLLLPPEAAPEAIRLLSLAPDLSTNDYHIHARPGETHILRLLRADEVETYYARLQAHFDINLAGFLEDERSAHAWRDDPKTTAFLDALEALQWNLADRYHRTDLKRAADLKGLIYLLSTQTADEINIELIADQIMNRTPADLVGEHSAPEAGEEDGEPSDAAKAWFFKLFFLRGFVPIPAENPTGIEERILLYTFLQKSDDSFDF